MKTATLRATLRIVAGLCAVAATASLQAGCETRHVLGAIDGGPPAQPDGDGNLPDGATVLPDVGSSLPDGATVLPDVGGGDNPDGAVLNQDGAVLNQDGAVLTPVQSWTGYIENYKFASGSDVIHFQFASDSAGHVVGTVTMGSGPPPPPATDPNVGYPPNYPYRVGPIFPTIVYEGFAYPMLGGTLTGRRLQFGVGFWELWQGWCAIQTPVADSGSCLPNWGGMRTPDGQCSQRNPDTGEYVPVDCGKLDLCMGHACICDASACEVRNDRVQISFDVTITNDLADGSIGGQLGDHNVHFTKDP